MTAEEIIRQTRNNTYQYKTNVSAYNNKKAVENTANVNSDLSYEQIIKNVRDGKYNFDFSTVDRDVEDAKRRLFPNRATQADVLAAEEKTNSQRAAEQAADYADEKDYSNMSYDEQKDFVKENRSVLKSNYRAARNDYAGKAVKGAITFWDSSDNVTDEEKEKFKAVKSQYKSDKKVYNQTLDDIKFAEKNEREAMAYNAMKDSDTVKLLADMDTYYQQQADDAKQAAEQARQMLEATGNSNNGSAWQSYQGRSHDIAKGNQYTANSAKYDNAVNALKEKGYSDKDIQDLYDYYKKDKDKKYTKEVTDIFDAMQDEGGLAGKVMANVASVSSKLSSDNKVAMAEDILYGLDAHVNDRYIDANTNSRYHLGQNVSDEIRAKTSEDIQRNSDNPWIANFIYQTGMSMADFGVTLPAASTIGQAGASKVMQEAASLGILSTSAAVNKTKEATDNGLNADQAASLGIIAGAAEIITEHASIDALFNSSSTGIKYILQNALTEGSEEVGSDIINEIADLIISGDKADIKAQYQNYLNEGYSDKDAFINVLVSKAKEYGTDFLGGALSGGVMSGGATAINQVTQNNQYRAIGNEIKNNGDAQVQINAGLARENTSKAYQAAQALQNSLEQNAYNNNTEEFDYSNLSSRKLGRLAQYNAQEDAKLLNDSAKVFEGDTAKSYVFAYNDNSYNGNVYDYNTGFNAVYMAQQQGKSIEEAYDMALDKGSHITKLQAEIAYEAAKNDTALNELPKNIAYYSIKENNKTNVNKLLNVMSSNLNKLQSLNPIYSIDSEVITNNGKISESISDYFDSIGNQAINKELGVVELVKSGAKSTVSHGFGPDKASAVSAIKAVIENGEIIDRQINWKNRNYDTIVIAGKGSIYGENSVIGVVVKKYPLQKHNAKFYLHEIVKIKEADLQNQTAPQLSVDTVSKSASNDTEQGTYRPTSSDENLLTSSASNNNVSHETSVVNNHSMQKSKVDTKAKAEFDRALYSKPKSGATILSDNMTDLQKAETVLIDKFAKNIGKEVIIVDDTEKLGYDAANGMYINDKIVLATNADGGMLSVYFGHELFHSLKVSSPEQAQVLEDFIINHLKNRPDYNYNARVEDIIEHNEFEGTREQQIAAANEEIAANACFTVFSEQANFESLVKQDRSLAQKVRDFFADFIERIEKALEYIRGYKEYNALENEKKVKQKILDMFDTCLKESQKNNTIVNDSEIKYSKKLGEFAEININSDDELDYYGIKNTSKVLNDYVGIQKAVIEQLKENDFFNENNRNVVVNADTDIVVEIGPEGIRETLSNKKNYYRLPRVIKEAKIATIRSLPEMIKFAEVVDFNQANYHDNKMADFLVLMHPAIVNGKTFDIEIKIKKSPQKNKFYIHNMTLKNEMNATFVEENAENSDITSLMSYDSSHSNNVSQKYGNVKFSRKEQPIDFNAILEENAELSEMNEDLQQMLKLTSAQNEKLKNEFKITDRHNISNNAVDKVAASLRKQYASSYDKSSLVSNLAGLYDYIANAGSNIDSGYIWQKANDIAKNIIANSQQKDTAVYDEYKELRNRIRNTAIRVSQSAQDNFADYNEFRRENFGRLRLSDSGIELDAFYNELSAEYPEFFNADITDTSEQLEALANFFEVTAPVYYNSAEQNAESMGLNMEQYANLIAGDIFDKYFDVPEVMTAAEKHKKEMDSLKLHYRNQIADMRQAYKNRYDERLREVKAENAKRVTKLRADKADALAKQKAHFEDVSQRGKDRRKKSQLRASIRKRLNEILNLANKPTKDKHIPIPIIESVRELCNAINLSDTQGDTRIKEKVLNFQSALDAVSSGRYFDNLDNADKAKILMNKKIAVGMTDSERYSILKGKKIYNVPVATNVDEYGNTIIENWNDINIKVGREKQNLINRIATQFGAFKEYSNNDIELDFEFTKNNFRESYNKQGKNFDDFAKMFSVFDRIVHNAVGIEIHNRNKEGYKVDLTLENVYVLVSAFQDGDSIVPVKLEIKQFSDKPNKLYVAVTSDKIKMTEVWKQGNTINGVTQNSRSVNISISDLFKKINPESQSLYKYIPSHFKDGYEDHTDFSQLKSRYANMYNELMQARVEQFISEVGNKTINELSVNDLSSINELLKITITQINNINRLFKKEQNVRIEDYAAKVSDELSQFKKSAIRDGMTRSLMYNSMKPEYFFQYLGSNTLLELYHDLRKGEDIWAVDISDARAYALEIRKKYGWQKWDNKSKQSFNTDYGTIELTLQERLAIYANSIGEHTKNHLLGGGFVYHKAKQKGIQKLKKQRNDSGNHRLSESDVENIVASLDENQKAYVRDMISYLSDVMGVKGNEVTKVLYGIELFREKMYYPAKIDKKSRNNSPKDYKAEQKIKNAGFTNSALPNAPQPVELMDFDDVWASHVDEMSKYHAFVLPLENMDRVYNSYQKNSDNKYSSVKEMLENAYGAKAITYIDDLLADINGGVVQEAGTKFVNRAISKFKKGAVFASASVAIQQPSAIGRALSEVDARYFAKTTFSGFNRKAYDEMKKYAPVAVIKEMGYFDTNMAQSTVDFLNNNDYEGIKEKVKAFVKDGSYRDEALSFFASKADEITWTHIWNACKAEIKAENSTLTQEQILEKAGERFTDVISKTQVYDSVFSRSGLMRSKDTTVKSAAAFMAEPTTSLNMLVNAVIQTKRGKMSKSQGARILGSLVAASVINSLLQSIVTAARADDDDKDWAEVYLAQLIPNFINNLNPFNQIVFLKDIINIFQGYDVTRADMNLFLDAAKVLKQLNSDKVSTYKKITGLSGAIAAFFGLPVKNVIRDVESAFNVGKDFFDDKKFSSDSAYDLFKEEMNNMFGFELFNADLDIALKAVSKGDIDTYNAYADEIYATDDAYDLLYSVLVKYGYNSSQYRTAEKKCIDIKKENGAKNPNPNTSMKNRAIKDYAKEKNRKKEDGGSYDRTEPYRNLCMDLYGDMTKVNQALDELNN